MSQMTLGGKPKVVVVEEPQIISTKTKIDSDSPKPMFKEKDGYHIEKLELYQESNLEGIKKYLQRTSSHEHPHGFMGGMWGSGGFIREDGIRQHFEELLEEKKEAAKKAFRKFKDKNESREFGFNKKEYYLYRLVPMKNWVVQCSKNVKEYLTEKGFDFEAWNKEFMAIPENEAGDEWNEKVNQYIDLVEKGSSVSGRLDSIRYSIKSKLGHKRHNKKMMDIYPELGIDAVYVKFKAEISDIAKLNKQLADLSEQLEGHRSEAIHYNEEV